MLSTCRGRQSFLVQMVEDRNDLSNAIAISYSMANEPGSSARPSPVWCDRQPSGEGWCFFIDGVSYLAVIASLLLMRIKHLEIRRVIPASVLGNKCAKAGTTSALFVPFARSFCFFMLISLMGYSYSVLLPVFAAQVLHGAAPTLGWLVPGALRRRAR